MAPGRGRNDLQWLCDRLAALGKAAASGAGDLRRGHRVRLCDPVSTLVVSGPGSNGLRDRRAVLSVVRRAAAGGAAVCADSAPASLDSKTELAKQLAAYELAMLGVPDGTDVTVQPLDEDWLGYYSVSSRQIVLSRSLLESGTAQETMDTIAHEAFHVQQAYVVENIDWDDAATQAAYYDQARRWLRNYQSGYVSGDEDILGYYFQPVEADARAYAKEETERLQELISRNLQEDK